MQQNPGFLVLYGFIKDALLSKVGVVKVWWEEKEQDERETYLDQPTDAFALIAADPPWRSSSIASRIPIERTATAARRPG